MWATLGDAGQQPAAIEALILDLDGLLIDSERWSWEAHNQVLAGLGISPLALAEVRSLIGLEGETEWATFRRLRPLPIDRAAYAESHAAAFVAIRAARLAPLPGVRELLEAAEGLGLLVGLASNSGPESIEVALVGLGVRDRFAAVASGQEVAHGKPDPGVYLLALRRLGLEADQALAIEDSAFGLAAARTAGLRCAVVPSELTIGLDFSGAWLRFPDLAALARRLPAMARSGSEKGLRRGLNIC